MKHKCAGRSLDDVNSEIAPSFDGVGLLEALRSGLMWWVAAGAAWMFTPPPDSATLVTLDRLQPYTMKTSTRGMIERSMLATFPLKRLAGREGCSLCAVACIRVYDID